MTAETLTAPSRRFRGSTLDRRMGAAVALAAIGIPPFVIGYWGVIYALVVVNLFLALSLFRTPDRSATTSPAPLADGMVRVNGMHSFVSDLQDAWSPDHKSFGMAVRDMSSHAFIFGQTGTGMTSLASAEAQPEGDHHD
jgi:hypothetical protein